MDDVLAQERTVPLGQQGEVVPGHDLEPRVHTQASVYEFETRIMYRQLGIGLMTGHMGKRG